MQQSSDDAMVGNKQLGTKLFPGESVSRRRCDSMVDYLQLSEGAVIVPNLKNRAASLQNRSERFNWPDKRGPNGNGEGEAQKRKTG